MLQDLRFSLRQLGRSPGFTLVAVLTLALGIGVNTALFSVIHSVLLRPLPYSDPQRIMVVFEKRVRENMMDNVVSPADFLDWRDRSRSFEHIAAQTIQWADLIEGDEPERLGTGQVSACYFDVLGVRMARGRAFLPEEDQSTAKDKVVIISHGLWQRRFGGDKNILGRQLNLAGVPYTVVGVLPQDFRYVLAVDLWVPWTFPENWRHARGAHFLNVVARLRPGVTVDQAQAEMDAIAAQLEKEYPEFNTGHGANVVALRETLVGDVRQPLLILFGAVGFVLLIACANVANLLLARGTSRQKEMAIRAAMGAGRGRLVRLLLAENVLLSTVAGTLGLLLALWAVDALKLLIPRGLPVMGLDDFSINAPVLLFLGGISFLTVLLFGLTPALQVSRVNLQEPLKESSRTLSPTCATRRLRSALVVVEVALSIVLLAGAGLMIRSFALLNDVNPGFDTANVLTLQLGLVANRYPQPPSRVAFYQRLIANAQTLPGVLSAGAISHLPMSGQDSRTGVAPEGRERGPDEPPRRMHHRIVTPGYFPAMGIPLREGRLLNEFDTADSRPVMLINQAAARRFWPGESAVGRLVIVGGREETRWQVVGVVGDVKHWGLAAEVNPEMYMPHTQSPTGFMNVVVRTAGEPAALIPALRQQLRRLDKDLPPGPMRSMGEVIAVHLSARRFTMVLLGVFAGLAMALASVGLYSVIAYAVAQRTHEFGVRMALGAGSADILRLVVRQGMTLTATGLLLGLAGALALTRLLEKQLFAVRPNDPLTYAAVVLTLAAVALVASWIPARRATKVDPMVALRYE